LEHVTLCNEIRDTPWYACLPYEEKGDSHTSSVYRIKSPRPKISGPALSLSLSPHLIIFHPHTLSRTSVVVQTVVPLSSPVVLDPGLGAHHRLIPGPRACCRLDPGLRARHRRPLPQVVCALLLVIVALPPSTSTLAPLECAAPVLFLKPSMRCSWSLSHFHRRPRPQLPQSAPPLSSSSSPRHVSHLFLSSLLWFT
jgi:hypothetical protein